MKTVGVIILVILLINILVGGLATQYVVQYWASYFKGVPVHVPFLPCAVAGLFLGEIAVPAAVGTWILSFVL